MGTMKSVAFVIRLAIDLLFFPPFFKCLLSVTCAIHINLSCAMRKPTRASDIYLSSATSVHVNLWAAGTLGFTDVQKFPLSRT